MADEIDSGKKRSNVILFWVHLGLAALILGAFVYVLTHQ
jgi:4-amino-4-deoxy-L-arabinose transferase-like glycosyltransferase